MLNSAGMGCHVHNSLTVALIMCFMLMIYVLLYPVLVDFRVLLNIYAKFGLQNDIEYNPVKSLCNSTYLKAKVTYNNTHRGIMGDNLWDSASSMFVNNAIDTFGILMPYNIYSLKKVSVT